MNRFDTSITSTRPDTYNSKKVYISDEVYDWLRSLLLHGTAFKTDADLNYYIEQNVKGKLLVEITNKYNQK